MKFTRDDVVDGAWEKTGKSVCTDRLDEAMRCKTLQEAIDLIVDDTFYWDGGYHGVLGETNEH
jgi:hypothetical protein